MKQPATNTLGADEYDRYGNGEPFAQFAERCSHQHPDIQAGDFIEASISNIQKVLLEGSLFVIIILMMFLMNWRHI